MEIATEEITFSDFGGNDYRRLVQNRADALGGRAFITEFAGPSNSIELAHPYLQNEARQHAYLTRLTTFISPEEMTVDPVFGFDAERADVSNVRDASDMNGLYRCERQGAGFSLTSDAIDPNGSDGRVLAMTPTSSLRGNGVGLLIGSGIVVLAAVAVAGFLLGRHGAQQKPEHG